MIRQKNFQGTQPSVQRAGQRDVVARGQDVVAVGAPLFDREPAPVMAQQCADGIAPIARLSQTSPWPPIGVEQNDVDRGAHTVLYRGMMGERGATVSVSDRTRMRFLQIGGVGVRAPLG